MVKLLSDTCQIPIAELPSKFGSWILERLAGDIFIDTNTVVGVMTNYDKLRDETVVVGRGELQEWLWEHRNRGVSAVTI